MDDGAVGRGAGDGVEGKVLQSAGVLAEAFQAGDDLDLVDRAALSVGREPVQKAGDRHAVAGVGLASSVDLDAVLAGAGQGAGIIAAQDVRASLVQGREIPGR